MTLVGYVMLGVHKNTSLLKQDPRSFAKPCVQYCTKLDRKKVLPTSSDYLKIVEELCIQECFSFFFLFSTQKQVLQIIIRMGHMIRFTKNYKKREKPVQLF